MPPSSKRINSKYLKLKALFTQCGKNIHSYFAVSGEWGVGNGEWRVGNREYPIETDVSIMN
jgi:hypothetical protein